VPTLRHVRATTVAVEKQSVFWVGVCSLIYLTYNAHAPSVACTAVLYFSTLSHKWHDKKKKKITEHFSPRKIPIILVRF
jgi:hypothetical protein